MAQRKLKVIFKRQNRYFCLNILGSKCWAGPQGESWGEDRRGKTCLSPGSSKNIPYGPNLWNTFKLTKTVEGVLKSRFFQRICWLLPQIVSLSLTMILRLPPEISVWAPFSWILFLLQHSWCIYIRWPAVRVAGAVFPNTKHRLDAENSQNFSGYLDLWRTQLRTMMSSCFTYILNSFIVKVIKSCGDGGDPQHPNTFISSDRSSLCHGVLLYNIQLDVTRVECLMSKVEC